MSVDRPTVTFGGVNEQRRGAVGAPRYNEWVVEYKRQHLVTAALLARFADEAGEIGVVDLATYTTRRAKPKAEAFVNNFIRFKAKDSEELWGKVENRIGPALDRMEAGTPLSPTDEETLISCLVLHYTRGFRVKELWDRQLGETLPLRESAMVEELSQEQVERVFSESHGLVPAGRGARELVAERIALGMREEFESGRPFRDVVHNMYAKIRGDATTYSLEVGRAAAGAPDFVISDRPALTSARAGARRQFNVAWKQADSVFLPVGPRHVVSISRRGGDLVLNAAAVRELNGDQTFHAQRAVYYRPGMSSDDAVVRWVKSVRSKRHR